MTLGPLPRLRIDFRSVRRGMESRLGRRGDHGTRRSEANCGIEANPAQAVDSRVAREAIPRTNQAQVRSPAER
jgi:hypothetical protein